MIKKGADPCYQHDDDAQSSNLFQAIEFSTPGVVSLLLKAGASAKLTDSDGQTALMWTFYSDHLAHEERETVAAMLIAAEADVNTSDRVGRTAMVLAARRGCVKAVKLMAAKGVDVNAMANGEFPIEAAVQNCHQRTVEILLESGADPTLKNKHRNKTALDLAQIYFEIAKGYEDKKRREKLVLTIESHLHRENMLKSRSPDNPPF